MEKRITRILSFLVVAAIGVGGFFILQQFFLNAPKVSQFSDDPVVVRMAISRTPLSAPFIIAAEKGFFQEVGITPEVTKTFGGHKALVEIIEGRADVATVSETPVMFNSFTDNPFRLFATFVSSQSDVKIMTRKDAGIKEGTDLKGKKVGGVSGASSHYFLDTFLLHNGLQSQDVTFVGYAPDKLPEALKNGEVDAISIWQPFGREAKELLGDNLVVLPSGEIYRETFNAVGHEDFFNLSTDVAERVVVALSKSEEFILANEEESIRIVAGFMESDVSLVADIWEDFDYELHLRQSLLTTIEEEARWAIENGFTDKESAPNYLDYINSSIMRRVYPERVTIVE